jgi:hypothetical protein
MHFSIPDTEEVKDNNHSYVVSINFSYFWLNIHLFYNLFNSIQTYFLLKKMFVLIKN